MDKKEKNQKREYPRFIDNKPCGKDLFEGKSHDSVAQNIANIIANSEAKIIGIDGGWGSGKSNMVNLVKEKLDSDKYRFSFMMHGDIKRISKGVQFWKTLQVFL